MSLTGTGSELETAQPGAARGSACPNLRARQPGQPLSSHDGLIPPVKSCNPWAGFPASTPGWHTLLRAGRARSRQRGSLPGWGRIPLPPEPPRAAAAPALVPALPQPQPQPSHRGPGSEDHRLSARKSAGSGRAPAVPACQLRASRKGAPAPAPPAFPSLWLPDTKRGDPKRGLPTAPRDPLAPRGARTLRELPRAGRAGAAGPELPGRPSCERGKPGCPIPSLAAGCGLGPRFPGRHQLRPVTPRPS